MVFTMGTFLNNTTHSHIEEVNRGSNNYIINTSSSAPMTESLQQPGIASVVYDTVCVCQLVGHNHIYVQVMPPVALDLYNYCIC